MKKILFGKKTLSVLIVSVLSVFAVILNSCSQESRLDGTTWTGSFTESGIYYDYYDEYEIYYENKYDLTLNFIDKIVSIDVKVKCYEDGDYITSYHETIAGSFSCDKSDITIIVNSVLWTGTIKKKTMTLLIGGETVVFTKQ